MQLDLYHCFLDLQDIKKSAVVLTPEAKGYLAAEASPEVQFLKAVPAEGASVKDLQVCKPFIMPTKS